MAGDSVPFEVTIRMRPGRSVTSMRLLDRKAIAHGCSNPCAMVSTTISPADELKVCATVGLAQGKSVQLATQIALNVVVIGNLMLPHAPRIAFTRHHRCLGSCDEKAAGQIARYRIGNGQSAGIQSTTRVLEQCDVRVSPGVNGALSICDFLDAALYLEKDVQQIGVYQDGDCHNAVSPRALHQIQLDQHPGESESDDPCIKAHAYPTKGLGIQPPNDIGAKRYSNQNAWNKQ